MGDIKPGDWVTINGCGPYEVFIAGKDSIVIRYAPNVTQYVRPEWVEKVPAPFRPELGTWWLDRDKCVWRVISECRMTRLSDLDTELTSDYVKTRYGPLTQLVLKGPPTEEHSPGEPMTPSYHDLHITTADIPRTSIFDLPFGYEVICNRVGGWSLFRGRTQVGAEFDRNHGMRLDVAGHVICDSLTPKEQADE